jgi:CheY-like chemotaxis protein
MNEKSRYSNQPVLLIAEDDETSFMLLKAYLSKGNYKILRAVNGKQSIELLEKNPDISLILMDLKMPVMDGYEATREIKKSHPGIPIIAQTAYALSGDNQKAIEAGCDDYVTKPINKEELLDKIERTLKN